MIAKLLQSCLTLHPRYYKPLGSVIHGILQARILERVAMASSRGFSQAGNQTHVSYVSCFSRGVLWHQHHVGSPQKLGRWTNGGEYKQVECAGNVLLLRFDVVFTATHFKEKKWKILNKRKSICQQFLPLQQSLLNFQQKNWIWEFKQFTRKKKSYV